MRGLPGLASMRSVTKYGISVVTLVFDDDVDIYFARQLVFERLAEASQTVPGGRRDDARARGDGDGRDLPVHARAEGRRAAAGLGGRSHAPAHAAGLGGDAAAQGRARRDGGELVRRVPAAVPGGRRSGQAAQVRPARSRPCTRRSGRTTRTSAATSSRERLGAVHHPRRRPDPVGGRHPEDRPEVGGRHAGLRRRRRRRSGSATPSGRAPR